MCGISSWLPAASRETNLFRTGSAGRKSRSSLISRDCLCKHRQVLHLRHQFCTSDVCRQKKGVFGPFAGDETFAAGATPDRGRWPATIRTRKSSSRAAAEERGIHRPRRRRSPAADDRSLALHRSAFASVTKLWVRRFLNPYAWGRPVVASDLGSRRELVEQGETGCLFPAGNVEQLGKAIAFLVERPELTAQMGNHRTQVRRSLNALPKLISGVNASLHSDEAMARKGDKTRRNRALSQNPPVRIAFIGGRGVRFKVQRYRNLLRKVGKRLADTDHDVTVIPSKLLLPPLRRTHAECDWFGFPPSGQSTWRHSCTRA